MWVTRCGWHWLLSFHYTRAFQILPSPCSLTSPWTPSSIPWDMKQTTDLRFSMVDVKPSDHAQCLLWKGTQVSHSDMTVFSCDSPCHHSAGHLYWSARAAKYKVPPTQWLKMIEMNSLPVPEVGSPKSRCQQSLFLLMLTRKDLPQASVQASAGHWSSLLSLGSEWHQSNLCLHLHMVFSLFLCLHVAIFSQRLQSRWYRDPPYSVCPHLNQKLPLQ